MKNILLIGGSYGIGLAIAEICDCEHNIFIASRTSTGLETLKAKHIPFDALTDELEMSSLPESIDGLVYCPGSINLRPFSAIKEEAFQLDMQINFFSMVKVIQKILPRLLRANQSGIVLFSSVAATTGMPFHTSIAAAKGAVEGFAKAFAAEYAGQIRVNVIAPSLTKTPLADKFLNTEAKQEQAAARNPLRRFGQPDDLAQMAVFLLSDRASWISGQVIHIDGGMSTLRTNH